MKKIILTNFIILFFYCLGFGQQISIYFEPDTLYNTDYKKYFYIDSADVDNIWQVGKPNKIIFDSAYTLPNALVTDTVNTYPANNTSSVMFWNIVGGLMACDVSFKYKIHSDTLVDYGKVEISGNGGLTWTEMTYWIGSTPVFSGNSKGWKNALFEFGPAYLNFHGGDTVLFKFTFTSDSIDTYKEGWMIDNIFIMYTGGIGISEATNKQNLFQIIYKGNYELELIRQENEDLGSFQIQIFDIHGKQIYLTSFDNIKSNVIHLPNISKGIYLYTIRAGNRAIQSCKIAIFR